MGGRGKRKLASLEIPGVISYVEHGPGTGGMWEFSGWQVEPYNCRESIVALEAGRGAGKDIVAIRAALRTAFEVYARKRANPTRAITNPVVSVWLISEQEKNVKQLRRDFRGELDEMARWVGVPRHMLYRYVRRDDQFQIGGANEIVVDVVLCKHQDSLRGPGVDVAVWTEFSTLRRRAAWEEEYKGTRTRAGREGITYLTYTPKGRRGLWVDVAEGCEKRGAWFHATSFDNEFLTARQVAEIRAEEKDGWIYEQERLARRVLSAEGTYPAFDRDAIERCLVPSAPAFLGGADGSGMRPRDWGARGVVVGVDLARMGSDEAWFVVVDFETGILLEIVRRAKCKGPELVTIFESLNDRYGGPEFVMDATQHQVFVADFVSPHVRIAKLKIYEKGKERLVHNLGHLLEVGRVGLPDPMRYPFVSSRAQGDFEELVRQLRMFRKVEVEGKPPKYEAPSGDHDDGVQALTLASDPIARSVGVPDARETREAFEGLLC